MKKLFPMLITVMLIMSVLFVPVSAAETFVDTIEDGFPKAHSWSDHMCYQYNDDMECSILVKQSDTGSPSTTEYIIYKMTSEITGFSLDCMHVNGLGNGETDIKVFVSSDCAKWTEVPIKASKQVFDDEVYIDFDHAYWLNSTVSNKSGVPSGNEYIKIEIEPFTVPESCTWNTVITNVSVSLSGKTAASAPSPSSAAAPVSSADDSSAESQPAESSAEVPQNEPSDNTSDIAPSDNAVSSNNDSQNKKSESHSPTVWIIVIIAVAVAAAAGSAVIVVMRNKKKTAVAESDAAENKEQ